MDKQFIEDVVLPELLSTGGATINASPYGMPYSLLRMDKYQPTTWVVGIGHDLETILPWPSGTDEILQAVLDALAAAGTRNSWSAIGLWVDERPWGETVLTVEPVETYTNHDMAVRAAEQSDQVAIFNLSTGEAQVIETVAIRHYLRDAQAEWLADAIGL
jgi:hypothetical protein